MLHTHCQESISLDTQLKRDSKETNFSKSVGPKTGKVTQNRIGVRRLWKIPMNCRVQFLKQVYKKIASFRILTLLIGKLFPESQNTLNHTSVEGVYYSKRVEKEHFQHNSTPYPHWSPLTKSYPLAVFITFPIANTDNILPCSVLLTSLMTVFCCCRPFFPFQCCPYLSIKVCYIAINFLLARKKAS